MSHTIDKSDGARFDGRAVEHPQRTAVDAPGRLRQWWDSRLGRSFLREFVLMYGLFLVYKWVRYLARHQTSEAFLNAHKVVHFERVLGIFTEDAFQRLALRSEAFVVFLNRYYVSMHWIVTIVFLGWLYVRAAGGYRHIRRLLFSTTLLGMLIHITYPLAPPRMLWGLRFVDTGALFGPTVYGEGTIGSVANQFAAMPSLHFGWAVLVAYGVVRFSRSRWRYVSLAHPVLTLMAIIMTANHYWLDAIIASLLLLVAFGIEARWPGSRRDLEEAHRRHSRPSEARDRGLRMA